MLVCAGIYFGTFTADHRLPSDTSAALSVSIMPFFFIGRCSVHSSFDLVPHDVVVTIASIMFVIDIDGRKFSCAARG
jgi:hypothetical protein